MLILITLSLNTSLFAQEAGPEKQQRWYLSTQFGLDTYPGFSTGFFTRESKLVFSELGYRFHRHVDVALQLGLMGETELGTSRIQTIVPGGERLEASWNSHRRNVFIGLGAKLNYRIGQGDFSFSVTFGVLRHSNLLLVKSPRPIKAKLRMAALSYGYHKVQVGYTYWATRKFGLVVGFSIFTQDQGNITRNVEYSQGGVGYYTVSSFEIEGLEIPEEDFLGLRRLIHTSTTHYVTLGLTAKIF